VKLPDNPEVSKLIVGVSSRGGVAST